MPTDKPPRILRLLLNYRDLTNFVYGIGAATVISATSLAAGIQNTVESAAKLKIENEGFLFYAVNSLDELLIGIAMGSVVCTGFRLYDYIRHRREPGFVDRLVRREKYPK